MTSVLGHISNSSLATCLETLLPTAPWILEAHKKGQTGHTTSEFDIRTTIHGLSAGISYPRSTVIQEVPTPLIKPDGLDYTSTVAPATYTGTKYSLMLTMGFANDPSKMFPSLISTEALPEDGAIDENKIQAQLNIAQSAKTSLSLSEGLMEYPSILPSMSRNVAELTDMSPASNEYTLITLKASTALPPEKVQSTTGTVIISTQPRADRPTTSTHDYLLASSPTWVVSDGISHLLKTPESSLRPGSAIVPCSTHISHNDLACSSSRASGCLKHIQQEGKTSILYDSSETFAAYTLTSLNHEEIPNSASTRASTTEVSTTSSTSDAKSSNGDDLTMSRSKGSHYIEKRSLGIVLGSVSGAGIVFCAILILHRPCYRRFRGPRKRMWISQNPENLNVRKSSFAGHSDQREISRFSVDS